MMLLFCLLCFFFKQKTAYEMRISDWSSDVCSSDLPRLHIRRGAVHGRSASSIPSSLSPKHGSESQPEAARSSSRLGSDRRESDDLRCPRATGPKSAAPLPHAMAAPFLAQLRQSTSRWRDRKRVGEGNEGDVEVAT